jgi:hypothetical protein
MRTESLETTDEYVIRESDTSVVCPPATKRAFRWKFSPILMSNMMWHLISWYPGGKSSFDPSQFSKAGCAGSDGCIICPFRLRGERCPDFHLKPHWPRQASPTRSQHRLWIEYLTTSFLRYRLFWSDPLGPRRPCPIPPILCHSLDTIGSPFEFPTLKAYLRALPSFCRRLLYHNEQCATDLEVWRAFRSRRRLEIVSDGSLASNIGTFGWRLLQPPSLILFEGTDPVDGILELANSTRSELAGYAAPLLLVATLSRYWDKCKFRWIVDSTAAISKVQVVTRRGARPQRQPNNVDFLTLIANLTRELRRPISITWVKGHQNTASRSTPLSRDAHNNIAVDDLATMHRLERRLAPRQHIPHLPTMQVFLKLNGLCLSGHFESMLRYHINGYHLRVYMQERFRWSDSI